jgi:hypothetical protein
MISKMQAQQIDNETFTAATNVDTRAISFQEFKDINTTLFPASDVPVFEKYNFFSSGNRLFAYLIVKDLPQLKQSLEIKKERHQHIYSGQGITLHDVSITEINGSRYIITRYSKNGDQFIAFKTDYNSKAEFVSGFIKFKSGDETYANEYIKSFLYSFRFK